MSEYELGVIGGGNMAEAILRGVVRAGAVAADKIIVSDPDEGRRKLLASSLGIVATTDNSLVASQPKVMLAIKPQVMASVVGDVAELVSADTVVTSIAAGVSSEMLDGFLGGRGRIVRVMPNTPMLVGEGMSAVAAGPRSTPADVEWASSIFAASGDTVVVEEKLIDAVIAVSGSGPAYFMYMVEAMVAVGVAEGLTEEVALKLATQTCKGAGQLMAETGIAPAELRRRVTSPGGTTQRAIETLDAAGVKDNMIAAFHACAERSRELASK